MLWRITGKFDYFAGLKPFAGQSALSAGYPSPGWLPAVRFIPCEGYPADKALNGHDRLESENLCDTRLAVPVALTLSDYSLVRTGIMMAWNRSASFLTILNLIAFTLHCGDNVIYFSSYPEPAWITGSYIVVVLYFVAVVFLMGGYRAFRRRRRILSVSGLLGFSLISLAGLGHYLYAPFPSLTLRMNMLILFEVFAACLMVIFVVLSQVCWHRSIVGIEPDAL